MSCSPDQALPDTWNYSVDHDMGLASPGAASIECEQPNNSLYTFTGNLQLRQQKLSLSTNQVQPCVPVDCLPMQLMKSLAHQEDVLCW